MPHPAQLPIDQLQADCQIKRTRGSGPGGQHRNKVETAIVVEHLPTGVRSEASERRSQAQNRTQAIKRLRLKLALELRCEPNAEPSWLWNSRVSDGRISINGQHVDLAPLLAEALDVICEEAFSVASTATRLGVSSSQLVKLLKLEPKALAWVNRQRQAQGKAPLR